MKKIGKWLALGAVVAGIAVAPSASAVSVVKSYRYDVNKYTGGGSNYHGYQYVNIPNWSRYTGSSRIFVSQGWNYTRYQHINYYSGRY
ncbi:TPA: hypothetical protein ACGO9B_001723 [Streptococcus suis]|uniref:hypothetical protein n=1 Tax=Streptococcus suis TaxID=1307 RepID=UPI002ED05575